MTISEPADLWIRRALSLLICILVVISSVFMWRASRLVSRVEQSFVALSGDIKQVTATAANISRDVDLIRSRLDSVERKTSQALQLYRLLDSVTKRRGRRTPAPPPETPKSGNAGDRSSQITAASRQVPQTKGEQ